MFKFVASNNGKYCAMQEDNKITCTQDNETKWTMEYPYKVFKMLFIGDNGTIVAIADDSVIKIYLDKYSSPEEIECLSKKSLIESDSILTNLNINANGSQLCFSTQNRTHNFAEGVQTFFTIPGAKKSLIKDRLHFCSLLTSDKKDYYEHKSEYSEEYKFLWAVSKDFFWLAIVDPDKKLGIRQTKISLINVQEFTVYNEETLKYNATAKKILVSLSGTMAVEVEDDKGKATILFKIQESPVRLDMKKDQTLDNLGMDYVAFRNSEDEIVIKTFDNYVKCYAPFNSLNQMGIPWSLQYIEKNDMLLLMYDKGQLSINRTSFDSLSTDSKRWQLIKERFLEEKEQNEEPQIVYAPNRFNLHKQVRKPKIITEPSGSKESNKQSRASVYAPNTIYKKPSSNRKLSLSLGTTPKINLNKQNENINYSSIDAFFGDTNTENENNQENNYYDPNPQYDYESYIEPQNPTIPTPIKQNNDYNNNEGFNFYSAITNEEQPPQKQEYMHDMIRRISAERGRAIRVIDPQNMRSVPLQGMPNNMQGMSNNMQGMPNNMQGMPNNMQGMPNNMQGMPNNMQGMSNNMQGMPNNMQGMPNNMQGMPNNMQGMPNNMQGMPNNMQGMPNNMQGMPNNMQGMPNNMQGMPNNMQGMPNNMQGMPNNMQGMPNNMQGMPNNMQGMPNNMQSKPNNIQKRISVDIEAIKAENKKIKKLIAVLEERFIQGEISEETYKELKEKYEKKQIAIKNIQ